VANGTASGPKALPGSFSLRAPRGGSGKADAWAPAGTNPGVSSLAAEDHVLLEVHGGQSAKAEHGDIMACTVRDY